MNFDPRDDYVIAHPEKGVLLGFQPNNVRGPVPMWSKTTPGFSDFARTFRALAPIPEIESIPLEERPSLRMASVGNSPLRDGRVSMADCVRHGLPAWTADSRPCMYTFKDRVNADEFWAVGNSVEAARAEAATICTPARYSEPVVPDRWSVSDCKPVTNAEWDRQKRLAVNPDGPAIYTWIDSRGTYQAGIGTSEMGAMERSLAAARLLDPENQRSGTYGWKFVDKRPVAPGAGERMAAFAAAARAKAVEQAELQQHNQAVIAAVVAPFTANEVIEAAEAADAEEATESLRMG